MSPYQLRVELAESDLRDDLDGIAQLVFKLRTQLRHPLQDDWDDAISVAIDHVATAHSHLNMALGILETY